MRDSKNAHQSTDIGTLCEKPTMKTTFETALELHEISDFFQRQWKIFCPRLWLGRPFISNWQEMCGVLKHQKAAQSLLTNIFKDYAKYSKEDYSDAEGLLSNTSAYYTLKKQNRVTVRQ